MRLGRAGLVVAVVLAAAAAGAAEPRQAPAAEKVWRVGVFESPPYAMRGADGEWRGLAIDLWKEIAAEKNLHYRLGEASPDAILDDIAHDRLDMSVAPFAATVDRQQLLDFSHAFLSVETGIAVRRGTDEDRWLTVAPRSLEAVRAAPLRRHHGAHVPRGRRHLAPRAAPQSAVRAAARCRASARDSGGPA